jgi:tRNA/rRNA methyltransferase
MSADVPPAIILVAPQMGENIGAAARAMANFNLNDLRLIAPRDGWPSNAATANAVGALDILNPVQVFDNTAEALKEFHTVYATTARPRDMRKKVFTPHEAAKTIAQDRTNGKRSAILFGGERAGLSNDDVALAHHIISVPVNPDFASLNLAQSVLLMAYEINLRNDTTVPIVMPIGDSAPANHDEVNELMMRLENELETHNFFRNPNMRPTMMRNIRNLFSRTGMTEQEAKTFHGIISALVGKKAGKKL